MLRLPGPAHDLRAARELRVSYVESTTDGTVRSLGHVIDAQIGLSREGSSRHLYLLTRLVVPRASRTSSRVTQM